MSQDYGNDESVYSDLYRIKGEILESIFLGIKLLGKIQKQHSTNMTSALDEATFNMYTINLYLKLRPLLAMGKLKKDKKLKKEIDLMWVALDNIILKDEPSEFAKMKEYFMTMMIIVKVLDIYGIGFKKGDPGSAWQQGLE